MKTRNLILTACVAMLALAACSKDESAAVNNRMKTVEVSLKNVVLSQTRGEAGEKITDNTPVKVNDFKVFLTDAAGNEYSAKVADGSAAAQTYWDAADLSAGAVNAAFHYVDPNCTKVIAVANLGSDLTYAEYKALENLLIDNQQNAQNLVLHAEATLTGPDGQHEDVNIDGTTYVSEVYKANLVMKPRVSRFEVDGFRVNFSTEPKYNTIEITDLAFQNYYPETSVATGVEAGALVNHMPNLANQAEVYNWFNDGTKPAAWYWDAIDVTINSTDANPAKDTATPLAYHIFAGDATPVFVIKLLADNMPAYLYSKGFYSSTATNDDGTPKKIEQFEEGKIYRMSAAGEVASDGSIPIDDSDIDPMDRCLDIQVDVVDWVVDLVYPEF